VADENLETDVHLAVPRDLFRRIPEMIDDLRPRQVARC
jgi:hypothetical protein